MSRLDEIRVNKGAQYYGPYHKVYDKDIDYLLTLVDGLADLVQWATHHYQEGEIIHWNRTIAKERLDALLEGE